MSLRILQIVPRLPPAVCGIGDYAWQLARGLKAQAAINSQFLIGGQEFARSNEESEFKAENLANLLPSVPQGIFSQKADAILLHVSNYGYQKRGVPLKLTRAMRMLVKSGGPPIIAMFHELYAVSSPRHSAFWLQPFQKLALSSLIRSASRLRTNREQYAQWINRVRRPETPSASVLPVFSNMGEVTHPKPLCERPKSMVMFASGIHGGHDPRAAIMRGVSLCEALDLGTLHVIGIEGPDEIVNGVAVRPSRYLSLQEATTIFSQCQAAYTVYNSNYLAKSGVFAAFAAHQMAVIVRGDEPVLPDGLSEGNQVWFERAINGGAIPDPHALQFAADKLHHWYQGHSLTETVKMYEREIQACLRLSTRI